MNRKEARLIITAKADLFALDGAEGRSDGDVYRRLNDSKQGLNAQRVLAMPKKRMTLHRAVHICRTWSLVDDDTLAAAGFKAAA
jgi:hypothetical protein